jgi:hypothetical protein
MRDKQEKNNQIADPPLLNAIKKGKAKQNKTKQNASACKERRQIKANKSNIESRQIANERETDYACRDARWSIIRSQNQ